MRPARATLLPGGRPWRRRPPRYRRGRFRSRTRARAECGPHGRRRATRGCSGARATRRRASERGRRRGARRRRRRSRRRPVQRGRRRRSAPRARGRAVRRPQWSGPAEDSRAHVYASSGARPLLGPTDSDFYVGLNRNKKDVLIDLSKREGVDLARRLAAVSDIVVQNFRPGVMERLGLGFDGLRKLREGLVYTSISAFGPTGPWSDQPANDIIMQSVSGLMAITGDADGGPVRIG